MDAADRRNATLEDEGYLKGCRYVLYDRDQKFCTDFCQTLAAGGVKCVVLPARSPNLNAFAERWVRSVKSECLSRLILFGEGSLRKERDAKTGLDLLWRFYRPAGGPVHGLPDLLELGAAPAATGADQNPVAALPCTQSFSVRIFSSISCR